MGFVNAGTPARSAQSAGMGILFFYQRSLSFQSAELANLSTLETPDSCLDDSMVSACG